jgi:N-acetylmuramoyl-L-alanine amidase
MVHLFRSNRITFLAAAFGAALFIFGGSSRAADTGFPIYFADSKLVLKPEIVNRVTYLPLMDIIQFLELPYTDSLALETLTIRAPKGRLVITRNSGLISINDQIVLLRNSILKEDERWLAPIDFLSQGLTRATGTEFEHRSGSMRVFAGGVDPPELIMNAQALGPMTRLTIRAGSALNLEVRRDEQNRRAVLALGDKPVNPLRERLDHKDRMVESIAFDDSDGNPKIVLALTSLVADIKVVPSENNRIFFVDLMRATETTPETTRPAPAVDVVPPKPDVPQPERRVRVVVVDPGHGGLDTGTTNGSVAEKDLTLALARTLRSALQSRLGATVLLTRDSDVVADNESRSAVANNNQANLFISLHIGHSANRQAADSSLFIMKENFGGTPAGVSRDRLFLPWFLGYRRAREASVQFARLLQEDLAKAIPGWHFPIRSAPLAVLSSATMPSLLLEVGNINNSLNAQSILDPAFQRRLVAGIADAVQRFSETAVTVQTAQPARN